MTQTPTTGGYNSPPSGEGDQSIPLDPDASPLGHLIAGVPRSQPKNEEEQRQADNLTTTWFQNSVKDEYTVEDCRVVILDGSMNWVNLHNIVAGNVGALGVVHPVSLPALQRFIPPDDLRGQGWAMQDSGISIVQSSAWEVKRPRPSVVAVALLSGVLPEHRTAIAYFELKANTGRS